MPSPHAFSAAEAAEAEASIAKALADCTKDHAGRPIIYTILRSVAASGLSRQITPLVVINGLPVSLAHDYAKTSRHFPQHALGRFTIRVYGGGMDMGFQLASQVAYAGGVKDFHHEWL